MLKLVLFSLMTVVALSHASKLRVLVLYESLCPDSARFMEEQLGPSYDQLQKYIDITLVPFGKSNSLLDGREFVCQHGPAECKGNREQSCVLASTSDQSAQVKFAVCQMTRPYKTSVDRCAQAADLSADISTCMLTDMGTQLQLQAEQVTGQYSPSFVPTIVYNDVFNQSLQESSLKDFHGTVCHLLLTSGSIDPLAPACQ